MRYAIVLEPTSNDDRPPAIRLRALLKFAIRAVGLRCIECAEQKPIELPVKPKRPRTRKEPNQ